MDLLRETSESEDLLKGASVEGMPGRTIEKERWREEKKKKSEG